MNAKQTDAPANGSARPFYKTITLGSSAAGTGAQGPARVLPIATHVNGLTSPNPTLTRKRRARRRRSR
jgi:hypothetical protein